MSILERLFPSWGFSKAKKPTNKAELSQFLLELVGDNVIDYDEYAMIEGILQFSSLRVRDVMISRAQMVTLDSNEALSDCIAIISNSHHSRFPVVDKTIDNIKGLVLTKDLLIHSQHDNAHTKKVADIARAAIFVPESKRLDALLKEFQSTHNHMAIVVDEYGGVSGVITIEDVIEQITGEIEDEHDHLHDKVYIHALTDHTYLVDALTPVDIFNDEFATSFSDEYFDTIGGLVAQKFGCVPKPGQSCTLQQRTFKVLRANSRQIQSFEVTRLD